MARNFGLYPELLFSLKTCTFEISRQDFQMCEPHPIYSQAGRAVRLVVRTRGDEAGSCKISKFEKRKRYLDTLVTRFI